MEYAIVQNVNTDFETTVAKLRALLPSNGFGILTEIDVSATLKKKLDVTYPRTLILGACNPPIAHQALLADPNIATLMPCNVVVRENNEGGVEVAIGNFSAMARMMPNDALAPVIDQAQERMDNILKQLV
ncbi:protein of unknown function DUF302 [Magnetococcus marinus MC-1]|uniref:DUF302 domain-containing protein n=1 Tax=Magnetococcus marinus (strain ATCC BAA-1437 / JCM 17883 / MC-1) TaxID=156889 RepID=A0L695_MAGMM|nr:DUF302 domain-containing protein [Magnetococcus marinus]ABK43488.1 protein of unknown function DUF302 [Magnetococcus marinus MC-1]